MNPRVVFEAQTEKLILHFMKINREDNEENFETCRNFILSNLLYHNFLDPLPKRIESQFEGLIQKYQILVCSKASKISLAYDKILRDRSFESNEQFDLKYRLLSLLLHLSNSDSLHFANNNNDEKIDDEEKEYNDRLLKNGIPNSEDSMFLISSSSSSSISSPQRHNSDSELSLWSESNSDIEENENEKKGKENEEKAFSSKDKLPLFPTQDKIRATVLSVEEASNWLSKSIAIYKNPQDFHELSDYDILRDLLWTLQNPSSSSSLVFDENFCLRPNVTHCSLSHLSLQNYLNKFSHTLHDLQCLSNFTISTRSESYSYQAYGNALERLLCKFWTFVSEIEKKVFKGTLSYSLLSASRDFSSKWFGLIGKIASNHREAVAPKALNVHKAIQLISTLHSNVQKCVKQSDFDEFLFIYFSTLRPYFRIIQGFLSTGVLKDDKEEFVLVETKRVSDSVWNFELKNLIEENIFSVPNYLKTLISKIFLLGKSVRVLRLLKEKSLIDFEFLDENEETLESLLLSPSFSEDEEKKFSDKREINSYLELAFEELEKPFIRNESFIDQSVSYPLQMSNLLEPLIHRYYLRISTPLLFFFKETLGFEHHLQSIRQIFLLEDGDIIHEFSQFLLSHSHGTPMSLTLVLREIISRKYSKDVAEFFFFQESKNESYSEDPLDSWNLKYRLEWPLNMVITENQCLMYNRVFKFLLKVKRAFMVLCSIRPKELDNHSLFLTHKILLLRSWLLHFVGNIQSYFMTRVLHSTKIVIKSHISSSTDVDELISHHDVYVNLIHDRCFLNKSSSILLNAVLKVLSLSLSLSNFSILKTKKNEEERLKEFVKMEEIYSRSHNFLATTLVSMLNKHSIPHLEGLKASLIYSCPTSI